MQCKDINETSMEKNDGWLGEIDSLEDMEKVQSEIVLEQFIEMCRYKQAQWDIGKSKESGVDCLLYAHQGGLISTEVYIKILEVVLTPTAKYEIIVK